MPMGRGDRARLFVAVPLPATVALLVKGIQDSISDARGVRPVALHQLHCTLAFIGEVDGYGVKAAREVVTGAPSGAGGVAYVSGLVLLPNARRPRVLALTVEDEDGVLARLHEYTVGGLVGVGVMSREARPFRAHATIARLKQTSTMQPMADCERLAFGVESVCLYKSELRREGAVYSVLERVDLQRPSGH